MSFDSILSKPFHQLVRYSRSDFDFRRPSMFYDILVGLRLANILFMVMISAKPPRNVWSEQNINQTWNKERCLVECFKHHICPLYVILSVAARKIAAIKLNSCSIHSNVLSPCIYYFPHCQSFNLKVSDSHSFSERWKYKKIWQFSFIENEQC